MKACCPPPKNEGKRLNVKDRDRELASLAKALAHPARVRILRHLAASSCVCGDIVQAVGLAQATVSQHLKVLKSAGLVHGRISGPSVCYALHPQALERLRSMLGNFK